MLQSPLRTFRSLWASALQSGELDCQPPRLLYFLCLLCNICELNERHSGKCENIAVTYTLLQKFPKVIIVITSGQHLKSWTLQTSTINASWADLKPRPFLTLPTPMLYLYVLDSCPLLMIPLLMSLYFDPEYKMLLTFPPYVPFIDWETKHMLILRYQCLSVPDLNY